MVAAIHGDIMRKTILILAGLLASTTVHAGVLQKQCACPVGEFGNLKFSAKCCKQDKAPPPAPKPPDDTNTCEPSPASCTGQWCTSCDEAGCLDIDGPDISMSLCDNTLSWCTLDGECGESSGWSHKADPRMVGELAALLVHVAGWWPTCGWERTDDANAHSCRYSCDGFTAAFCTTHGDTTSCSVGVSPFTHYPGGASPC
jgi:hypothetical protein